MKARERAVFDRRLMRLRLARATAGAKPADFLLVRAAEELNERLSTILRHFEIAIDLATPGPQIAEVLTRRTNVGRVYRAAPIEQVVGQGPFLRLVADEEALPFAAASANLIVSVLALHFVNDLPGTLVQIRQTLQPDGLFIGCLLGGRTLQELQFCLAAAEAEIVGGASPRVAPFADLRDLGALLQRAGLALPVTDCDVAIARYDSMFGLIRDLRAMGAGNSLLHRQRKLLSRPVLGRAAAIYAERFSDPDHRVRATFELVWLLGWAPHPSQPQPLRPGSAKMPLSAALKRDDPR